MADNKEEILCPACQSKMSKVYMPSEGINVDVCLDGCGGIYFDNREFEKFDEQHENIDKIIESYADKTFSPVDKEKQRVCPVCGANMVKHYASAKKEVEIDECYSCGGVFLDYGELEQIRSQYPTTEKRVQAMMDLLYESEEFDMEDYSLDMDVVEFRNSHRSKIINNISNFLKYKPKK